MPIGAFIADFACIEAQLVLEVDGPSHATPEGQARDAMRDRWFAANGWRVVRVPNDLVTGGGDLALDRICAALDEARRGCRALAGTALIRPLLTQGPPFPARGRRVSWPHKPTDSEMGPHNFGGGEAGPRSCGRSTAVESVMRVFIGKRRGNDHVPLH